MKEWVYQSLNPFLFLRLVYFLLSFIVLGGKRMLSKKLTFSLTSLVVLLVAGLVFAPSVMADGDKKKTHFDLGVTIAAAESMVDVSAEEGMQIASGRHRNSRALDLDGDGTTDAEGAVNADTDDVITLSVSFTAPVNLELPGASLQDVEEAAGGRGEDATKPTTADSGGNFGVDDIYVAAFDVEGRQLGVLPLTSGASIEADFIDATSPGRNFLVSIHQNELRNAYGSMFEISKLVFFIPKGIGADPGDTADAKVTRGVRKADLGHVIAHFGPEAHQHLNKASNQLEIDLVDADQGNPMYYKGVSTTSITTAAVEGADDTAYNADGSGTPGVVTIDQLRERAGFIETGPFDIRIILTEEPMGGLTTDKIMVEGGGAATAITKGTTLKGALPSVDLVAVQTAATGPPAVPAITIPAQSARDNALTPAMASYYVSFSADGTAPAAPVDGGTPGMVTATLGALPEATGRDNMYHQYFVTITPNAGVNGALTISLKQFDDNVVPVPNRYTPLSPQQRNATQLAGAAKLVRDIRVMNETLMVQVSSAGDTKMAAAKTAYDARQAIYDANPLLKSFGNPKLVIPAGGYLVLAAGKTDSTPVSGVVNPNTKTKDKKTAAQQLYNVIYDFKLPIAGSDLSSFFRNGGAFSLAYQDIPEATDSGHGDSKGATGDDATGYTAATTNAYAAGAVIINEIMWGQDAGSVNGQYIELHNPGTAAIGLDNKEWIFAVGTPPAGFTAIDTVSNNPASGYWGVPGKSGVTVATAVHPVPMDLVSMSRMTGATDGTAAASWAASILPSANILGQRIGTPGAPNKYMTPVAPTPEPAPEPVKVPVAKVGDLIVSEVMVASNAGRLPQWIEIANTSAADVSLMGWSVNVDNDPTDADVVTPNINIPFGDVTLGAGQVVLLVSKTTNRNSGVAARSKDDGNAGAIDSNRLVDVQSLLSPNDDTYTFLSAMAFRIGLVPPAPAAGGVIERGDVAGNLGQGWELPMSEGSRSSLIRREMGKTAEIMGTDAAGWVLASDTALLGAYVGTYYGDKDDMGTPGYNAGGALPVELSKFGAKRDPLTGQVIVTWETQSELNNAGFYIKRSQQKNSQFVAVNPTMIPGAGTTSEKQSYTYTDTTAKPNIVYYYQIEDVSLDGNRQTLTRAHRLKGHVGAAGKATTTWGDLKTSLEQ